jgi:hypothetical protein
MRKNMAAFFDGESPDDWEPPIKDDREDTRQSVDPTNDTNRNWWGSRSQSKVPRVILPRDRKESKAVATSNPTVPPATTAPPGPMPTSQAPSLTAPSSQAPPPPAPKSELVAFGGNPNGETGKVTRRLGEDLQSTPNAPLPAEPKTLDTGMEEVDVAGALQSLPPQYRQIVERTLEAVKQGKDPDQVSIETGLPVTQSVSPPRPDAGVSVRLSEATKIPTDMLVPTSIPEGEVVRTSAQELVAKPIESPTAPAPPSASATPVSLAALTAPVSTAPSSEPATKPTSWYGIISEAIERLETELESNPPADESLRRSQELTLRMLYVAQRRLDDALRPIDRMDEHEQDYVRHQMQALYEASNPDANPSRARHWSSVMVSQREATSHLAAVSNLEVRSVAFCTQVDGYGMYQRFGKYQFNPDQDVLLYCEVDNVSAEKVKSGFETQLQGSYEIRDSQGRLVADQDLPMEPEVCLNHRRDYFMVYRIYMPQQIPAGNYELRLTIHDKKGGKYGHSNAPFEIRN